jgi:drug/metabolite transporter superfamily protein YnfA
VTTAHARARPDWIAAITRYLLASVAGHLAWEVAQLPFYTLWLTDTAGQIAWAVVHCTAGDIAIASGTLTLALAVAGTADWPGRSVAAVGGIVIALSVAYTAYSEHLNTVVRQAWTYTDMMPTVFGIGLLPLAQWVIVPIFALTWGCRRIVR